MESVDLAVESLRRSLLFSQLNAEQFSAVATLLRADTAKQAAYLVEQGYGNTNLFVLRRGRAVARLVDPKTMRELRQRVLLPGAVFNESAFVTGGRSDEAVEVDQNCTVWYVQHDEFAALLASRPDIQSALRYAPEIQAALNKYRAYPWLQPGELVEVECRRHWWRFGRMLWLPVALLAFVIGAHLYVPELFPLGLLWAWGVLSLPYAIWHFVDWRNDYLVLTDQRVVKREKEILVRDLQDELKLDRIDNVRVHRLGLTALIFNYGTITLQATGVGSTVEFDFVHDPDVLKNEIFAGRARAQASVKSGDLRKIRSDIRVAIELAPRDNAPAEAKPAPVKSPWQVEFETLSKAFAGFRDTIAPRSRVLREGGKIIVYRRHWFDLLRTVWIHTLVLLTFIGVSIGILYTRLTEQFHVTTLSVCGPIGLLGVVVALLWFYRYEDWRNDQYILEPERIVDYDRKPFGLAVSRKEVSYEKVTNVQSEVKGTLNILFNVGNVVIKTGGEGQLVFERVSDPHSIQQEIYRRVEAAQQRKNETAQETRRKELAQWIGMYDELSRLNPNRKIV